jgi:hypothetical protein
VTHDDEQMGMGGVSRISLGQAMFLPWIFMMSVQKKFLVRWGIAINARQDADFLLFMQIPISANINVYHARVIFYLFL